MRIEDWIAVNLRGVFYAIVIPVVLLSWTVAMIYRKVNVLYLKTNLLVTIKIECNDFTDGSDEV